MPDIFIPHYGSSKEFSTEEVGVNGDWVDEVGNMYTISNEKIHISNNLIDQIINSEITKGFKEKSLEVGIAVEDKEITSFLNSFDKPKFKHNLSLDEAFVILTVPFFLVSFIKVLSFKV